MQHVKVVLKRVSAAGFKLNQKKCIFVQKMYIFLMVCALTKEVKLITKFSLL